MVPSQPPALEPFLSEVRAYCRRAAMPIALRKGDALTEAERDAVAQKMHDYTGLSVDYLKAANLRVSENAFAHELLHAQRKTVGRLDGRFVGPTWDPLEKEADYDPQSRGDQRRLRRHLPRLLPRRPEVRPGRDLPHDQLRDRREVELTAHDRRTACSRSSIPASTWREALIKDANLKVLVLNGYYDLATPFSATEYVMTPPRRAGSS